MDPIRENLDSGLGKASSLDKTSWINRLRRRAYVSTCRRVWVWHGKSYAPKFKIYHNDHFAPPGRPNGHHGWAKWPPNLSFP